MKLIGKNISTLMLVNISNYIFPLLVLPYTSRVLGPEVIGQLALAQAFIIYFTFVVDFGFNITATRDISNVKDKHELSYIFSLVTLSKFIIFAVVFFAFLISFKLLPLSKVVVYLIFIGMIQVFGSVIFPIWLFQGIQRLSLISIGSTVAKLVSTILIFFFIKSPDDIYKAMLFQNLGFLMSGFFCYYVIYKNNLVSFVKVSLSDIPKEMKKGGVIFISYIFSSCYTTLNTFFLSFSVGTKEIGYFSSADKLRMVSQSFFSPIQQAVFPHIASQRTELSKFKKSILRWGSIYILICFLISLSTFILSKLIVSILLGSKYIDVVPILKVLSCLPFIISIAVVYGQWGLINLGKERLLAKIYAFVSILHLSYVFVLINYLGSLGLAIAIVITEGIAGGMMVFLFYKIIRGVDR